MHKNIQRSLFSQIRLFLSFVFAKISRKLLIASDCVIRTCPSSRPPLLTIVPFVIASGPVICSKETIPGSSFCVLFSHNSYYYILLFPNIIIRSAVVYNCLNFKRGGYHLGSITAIGICAAESPYRHRRGISIGKKSQALN